MERNKRMILRNGGVIQNGVKIDWGDGRHEEFGGSVLDKPFRDMDIKGIGVGINNFVEATIAVTKNLVNALTSSTFMLLLGGLVVFILVKK